MKELFLNYEGELLHLPEKNLPDPEGLKWHRENLFQYS